MLYRVCICQKDVFFFFCFLFFVLSSFRTQRAGCDWCSVFRSYFGLEMTPFMVSAFNSFDVDDVDTEGHLTLDFGEFLAAIWNFCTFDHGQLVEFAFNIYDTEGDGAVDIKTLAEHVHNSTDVEGDLPDLMKCVLLFLSSKKWPSRFFRASGFHI